jgi:hypothetical protein
MSHTFSNNRGQSFTVWMNDKEALELLEALNKTETPSSSQWWSIIQLP